MNMVDEARYVEQQMIRQERCTKGRCAMELSHIIAQYHRTDPTLIDAIIAYKDKLNKEAANI